MRRSGRPSASAWVVAGLLLAHWILAQGAASTKCTTFDELAHMAAGHSYWTAGDYRLQPENGNWPQRLAGLPLVLLGYRWPGESPGAWERANAHAVGDTFLHGSGNDADRMLSWSRGAMGLVSVALGALVCRIAFRLFDRRAAIASAVLFAFCPTMLCHGALATSDISAAFFFTAGAWGWWELLQRVSARNFVLSSLAVSGLFLSKFSAPILLPIAALLTVVRLRSGAPLPVGRLARGDRSETRLVKGRFRQLAVVAGLALGHALVVLALIWLSYGLRFDATGDPERDHVQTPWADVLEHCGEAGETLSALRSARVFPEAYLYGSAYTLAFSKTRKAFFNGEFGLEGWTSFFPYCFAVKTPLSLFAAVGLALAALARGRWSAAGGTTSLWYRAAPLWSLWVVYWAFALTSALNIGHRHLLPTYPPLYVLGGGAVAWLARREGDDGAKSGFGRFRHPIMAIAVLGCLALHVVRGVSAWPNYLAYFNCVDGGSRRAYRHLVDSSLDWGQDLPALERWLDTQELDPGTAPAYLVYFGTGNIAYYDVPVHVLPSFFDQPRSFQPELRPGLYCISATMLQSVYSTCPGPWSARYERQYQEEAVPVLRDWSAAREASGGQQRLNDADKCRISRLCAYVRTHCEPIRQVNHSINVYRLTEDDLDAALNGPPPFDSGESP